MTALDKYVRLESDGIWRETADAQRRDVTVSFGDATLVISDRAGRPLSHWSLPALIRQNPNRQPAVYAPDDEASELLEIADDMMIEAIEQVRRALDKTRPHPGKLRHWITAAAVGLAVILSVIWLPGALMRQTLAVVPLPKRMEIGATMLGHMQLETGSACREPRASEAAARLATRLFGPDTGTQIIVVPQLARGAVALPGNLIVLDYNVLKGADDPAVAAGYVLAAHAAARQSDPLGDVLSRAGLGATFRLLTTGEVPGEFLEMNAAAIVASAWTDADPQVVRPVFAAAKVPTTPYAGVVGVDLDPDPVQDDPPPMILDDADWVSLQNICNI